MIALATVTLLEPLLTVLLRKKETFTVQFNSGTSGRFSIENCTNVNIMRLSIKFNLPFRLKLHEDYRLQRPQSEVSFHSENSQLKAPSHLRKSCGCGFLGIWSVYVENIKNVIATQKSFSLPLHTCYTFLDELGIHASDSAKNVLETDPESSASKHFQILCDECP